MHNTKCITNFYITVYSALTFYFSLLYLFSANATARSPSQSSRQPFSVSMEIIVIIVGTSSIGMCLISLITVMCCQMARSKKRYRYNPAAQEDLEIDVNHLQSNDCYGKGSRVQLMHTKLEALEYPRNKIVYIADIGQGAFGRVFKAKAPHLVPGEEQTVVAVKVLKDEASEEMQKDFEREASLMVEFHHVNIVRLLGICALGKPMCLLFEYMNNGDLNDYLRKCSPEHFIVRQRSNEFLTNDVPQLDYSDLLNISQQIAAGMVYLSGLGYVHRDLATRNCLVSDNLVVKISDFGLTRNVHSNDYYKGSEHDAIPIRWMPVEAILYNKFTSESDVWSFGVVLWEIFSFALQPYYGMTHEEVIKFIKSGHVLSCPDNTPIQMYEIMKTCWTKMPKNRPSFPVIYKTLQSFQQDLISLKSKRSDHS